MSIQVITTGRACGAEIRGVDVSKPISEATFAAIETAFDQHGVVFFRGQTLTAAQQVAFSARFGPVEQNHNAEVYGVDGSPDIYQLSNILDADGKQIGVKGSGTQWHTDMSYAAIPARATMLYCLEVPVLHGLALGDTSFANARAAYNALPGGMKSFLEGKRGVFDFRGRRRGRVVDQATIDRYPPVEHPIVRAHPRTGEKGLYVMNDDCNRIAGMDETEGKALIAALADHITRPDFVYRHQWQAGDCLIWDNCTVQHQAIIDFDLPQRRRMWRTTVRGTKPV